MTQIERDELSRIGAFVNPLGDSQQAQFDQDGDTVQLLGPGGDTVVEEVGPGGRTESVTDASGDKRSVVYDEFGRVAAIVEPDGSTSTVEYDALSRVTATTDSRSAVSAIEYSPAGRVTATIDPRGNRTEYEYDDRGLLVAVEDAEGGRHLTEIDPDGRIVANTSPEGEVVRTNYDGLGRATSIEGPAGVVRELSYNGRGDQVSEQRGIDGGLTFVYDELGMLAASDANGGAVEFRHDERGNATEFIDQAGNSTQYGFDLADQFTSRTDPLGRQTTFEYDEAHNISSVTTPDGQTVDLVYDAERRLTSQTFADGEVVTYSYDNRDRIIEVTDSSGTISYEYDAASNVTSVTEPDGAEIQYSWDLNGNRTGITYPDGSTVTYVYDALNRIAQVAHPDSGTVTMSYNADSQLVAVEYPDGRERRYEYENSRLVTYSDGDQSWTLDYDGSGRLSQVSGADSFSYVYDDAGQLISATQNGRTWSYVYDVVGNLVEETDSVEGTTTWLVDEANQLVSSQSPSGEVLYTYDETGRLVEELGEDAVTTYEYDSRGRLFAQTTVSGDEGSGSSSGGLPPCSTLAVDSFQAGPWTFTFQVRNTTSTALAFEFVIPDANYELTNLVFNGSSQDVKLVQVQNPDGTHEITISGTLPPFQSVGGQQPNGFQGAITPTNGTPQTNCGEPGSGSDEGSGSSSGGLPPCSTLAVDSFQAGPWTFTFQVRNTTSTALAFEFVIPDANYELTNLVFNGSSQDVKLVQVQNPDGTHEITISGTLPPFQSVGGQQPNGFQGAITPTNGTPQTNCGEPGSGSDDNGSVNEPDSASTESWIRSYNPDGTLQSVSHATSDGASEQWDLRWDRTARVGQLLEWTGPTDQRFIIGTSQVLTGGQATVMDTDPLGNRVGNGLAGDYDPYGATEVEGFGLGYRGELHVGSLVHLRNREHSTELRRFTSVDAKLPGVGLVATSPYAYAANDPVNLADPLGLSPTDADLEAVQALHTDVLQQDLASGGAVPDTWDVMDYEERVNYWMKVRLSTFVTPLPQNWADLSHEERVETFNSYGPQVLQRPCDSTIPPITQLVPGSIGQLRRSAIEICQHPVAFERIIRGLTAVAVGAVIVATAGSAASVVGAGGLSVTVPGGGGALALVGGGSIGGTVTVVISGEILAGGLAAVGAGLSTLVVAMAANTGPPNSQATPAGPAGTPSQAQNLLDRGRVPRQVGRDLTRIDPPSPSNPFSQWEAHVGGRGSSALQADGTWKHGASRISNATREWLRSYGWNV